MDNYQSSFLLATRTTAHRFIFSTLTTTDIEQHFTEYRWIRKELSLLLDCHGQDSVYDRALFACSHGLLTYLQYMHDLRIIAQMMVKALSYPIVMEWLWGKGADWLHNKNDSVFFKTRNSLNPNDNNSSQ